MSSEYAIKDFEQCYKRLEEIAIRLESESIGLNEALLLYEEGTSLVRALGNMLLEAKEKVRELEAEGEA